MLMERVNGSPMAGDGTEAGETLTVVFTSAEGISSHSKIVPSPLPLASVRPSGLNDTLSTLSVCPGEGAYGGCLC